MVMHAVLLHWDDRLQAQTRRVGTDISVGEHQAVLTLLCRYEWSAMASRAYS
jgi:hypothetical protein